MNTMNVMEVDINEFLNGRTIKMEHAEVIFGGSTVESSDPLSDMPQFVNDTDLGLIQSGSEILNAPLTVFTDEPNDEDTIQSNDSSDEIIIQLMDIRTTLSKLRTMLEQKLATDLTDYTFWLQDAKMLESHKTLVEQCIKGSGVVQVNIQIRSNERKINILDVLKPDEEYVELPRHDGEDNIENEDPQSEACSSNSNSVNIPHAANVKWIVDGQFKMDYSRSKVPNDPNEWSVHHVKLWIQWAVRQFNMTGIKLSDWSLGGKALCAMTNTEFRNKVPSDPGDIFWTHFELLRKCKFIAVIQNDSDMNRIAVTNSQPVVNEVQELPAPSTFKKKKQKEPISMDDIEDLLDNTPVHTPSTYQIQLWQFLLELLTCPDFFHVIQWLGDDGEFILLEPEKVAKLWGARKLKPTMNYEKLSRALRYYYDGDMISKVPGKRFVYKFVCDLKQLIGYTAAELNERVKKAKGII